MRVWARALLLLLGVLCSAGALPATPVRAGTGTLIGPTRAGTVTITDYQSPFGCDNIFVATKSDTEICAGLWDNLFLVDNTGHERPDLSATIPTIYNGGAQAVNGTLVITYTLKPQLRWSDGTPLTTDDVAFSFALAPLLGLTLAPTVAITPTSPTTLVVTYSAIDANVLADGVPPILPRAYLRAKYGTSDLATIATRFTADSYHSPSDVFSGPFAIGSWSVDGSSLASVTLVPNPYYTALPPASGGPRLAQLRFTGIATSEGALASALAYGTTGVNVGEDFQPVDLPVLRSTSRYTTVVTPTMTLEHLELNLSGPLADRRVRQALQLAIDKTALFQAANAPLTTADPFLLNTVVPPTSPWHAATIAPSAYNPDLARTLLAQAGYITSTDPGVPGNHLTLNLVTSITSHQQRNVEVGMVTSAWNAIGVLIHITNRPPYGSGGLFSSWDQNGVLARRAFDVALFAWTVAPDPASEATFFNPALIPSVSGHDGAYQNYTGITETVQWTLLQQADQTLAVPRRAALLGLWQAVLTRDLPWIMLYSFPQVSVTDGTVGSYLPTPATAVASNEWNAYAWYTLGPPPGGAARAPGPLPSSCPGCVPTPEYRPPPHVQGGVWPQ